MPNFDQKQAYKKPEIKNKGRQTNQEIKKTIDSLRSNKLEAIDQELSQYQGPKNGDEFRTMKSEILEKYKNHPDLATKAEAEINLLKKQRENYQLLLAQKMVREIIPVLEKQGIETAFVFSDIVRMHGYPQVLCVMFEKHKNKDRIKVLKELLKRNFDCYISWDERFAATSQEYQSFFDIAFASKDKKGNYVINTPKDKMLSEKGEYELGIDELPTERTKGGEFRYFDPAKAKNAQTNEQAKWSDIKYNGLYLDGREFTKQILENKNFTSEQLAILKKTRSEQIKALNMLGLKFFGQDIVDETTAQELKNDLNNISWNNVLTHDLNKIEKDVMLKPELVPQINGLNQIESQAIFTNLVRSCIFGWHENQRILKNKLLTFPDKIRTDVPILILANDNTVIETVKVIEENLKLVGRHPNRKKIHGQVVEFMKTVIADMKGVNSKKYWQGHDKYELLREF